MIAEIGVEGFIRKYGEGRSDSYDGTAKLLHWMIAALVVTQYATKLVPVDALGLFTVDHLDAWRVSIGPTILAFMAVRLAWWLTHRLPSPPDDLQLVSRATYWLFYAILLLLPVLGCVAASRLQRDALSTRPDATSCDSGAQ